MKELNNILSDKMKQLMNEYGTISELIASKAVELHPQLKEHKHKLETLIFKETIFEMGDITFRKSELNGDGTTRYDEYADLINALADIGETMDSVLHETLNVIDDAYIYDFDILGLCEMSNGTQLYEYYKQTICNFIYEDACSDEEINVYIDYFGEDSVIAEIAKSRLAE